MKTRDSETFVNALNVLYAQALVGGSSRELLAAIKQEESKVKENTKAVHQSTKASQQKFFATAKHVAVKSEQKQQIKQPMQKKGR